MNPEKFHTGHIVRILTRNDPIELTSAVARDETIWGDIDYHYKIKSGRDAFFKSKGLTSTEIQKIEGIFKSSLEQAKNFYYYAKQSNYKSAPLLYYYSFMNLAKAKIVLEDPGIIDGDFIEFHHGIRQSKVGTRLDEKQCQAVQRDKKRPPIFTELYKLRFNQDLGLSNSITIKNALRYITDISYETERVIKQKRKVGECKILILADSDREVCWNVIAVPKALEIEKYRKSYKRFLEEFDKIHISDNCRQNEFKITPQVIDSYEFYESKIEYELYQNRIRFSLSTEQLNRTLKNLYQTHHFQSDSTSHLLLPLNNRLAVPMDELIANYTIMFYLSRVVRYHPEDLDKLLAEDREQGWLLKSFIEQAPSTFLTQMTSWIFNKDYLIHIK